MEEQCIEVRLETGRKSDDFHHAFRHLRTFIQSSAESGKAAERCRAVARAYDEALNNLLECLRSHDPCDSLQNEINATLEFKRLLAEHIKLIAH